MLGINRASKHTFLGLKRNLSLTLIRTRSFCDVLPSNWSIRELKDNDVKSLSSLALLGMSKKLKLQVILSKKQYCLTNHQ